MDAFAQLPASERRIYFEQTAARLGVSPQIVEKDFWVCWTLKQLFVLPDIGPHLIFKGGTSLSKVFRIIERFSEDIDVSIERGFLGFGGDNEPEAGGSNKEKQRRIEALMAACQQKIEGALLARVAQHKSLFFKSSWASYGEATRGTLRIVPPEQRLNPLREDYRKMQEMFFGTPPEFSAMINVLRQWESDFNH